MGPTRQDEAITGINVTPLVDVALVLLVILMVTATYIVAQTIPLDLPEAATGQPTESVLAISVDARGRLFLDGQRIAPPALRQRARSAAAESAARALIAADGATPHRHVVRVIDLLRQEGISELALNVAPEDLDDAD